ncbi:MAG: 3-phosphoshikimate 1-carboxyvinyltransferase, partial [Phycisphaerales bacterium]|nr:3-phosphoshikimate 1-carboxyvinyltransferase [Phycisphaerales bacterium]
MSVYRCTPVTGPLDAVVEVPGSKSLTNRALVLASLADGRSILRNILLAEDTRIMIDALRRLGIAITIDEADHVAEVNGCDGHIPESDAELFCGNSGTTMRFLTALVALGRGGRYRLGGVPRMHRRPIGTLVDVLGSLGTGVEYLDEVGFPPIVVHADGLRGGYVSFHAPQSSQMVSGLLLAAPYAARDVMIDVIGESPSVPFLKMTTALMERFGVGVIEDYGRTEATKPPFQGRLRHEATESENVCEKGATGSLLPVPDLKKARADKPPVAPVCISTDASHTRSEAIKFIVESSQRYRGTHYAVEPDATNAMYFLSAAAVAGGRVTVSRLGTTSLQGDVRFVDVLERMGCRAERETDRLTVFGPPPGTKLRGIDIDLHDMPDTAMTLAVLALFADAPTTLRNLENLRVKETDRLAALRCELGK